MFGCLFIELLSYAFSGSLSTSSRVVNVCSLFLALASAARIFNRLSRNPITTGNVHPILHHGVDFYNCLLLCISWSIISVSQKKSLTRETRRDIILLHVSCIFCSSSSSKWTSLVFPDELQYSQIRFVFRYHSPIVSNTEKGVFNVPRRWKTNNGKALGECARKS